MTILELDPFGHNTCLVTIIKTAYSHITINTARHKATKNITYMICSCKVAAFQLFFDAKSAWCFAEQFLFTKSQKFVQHKNRILLFTKKPLWNLF